MHCVLFLWSNQFVRRALTLALLIVFGLPIFSPLLALGAESNSSVPACCRRDGKQHCLLSAEQKSVLLHESGPEFRGPEMSCPCRTQVWNASHRTWVSPGLSAAIYAEVVKHPTGTAQTESLRRISEDRSRQKRGPPAYVA